MKTQPGAMAIALAIAFAVCIALAVALICVTYFHEDVSPSHTQEPTRDTTRATTHSTTEKMTTAATADPTKPLLPDMSNGLSFLSLGNGECKVTGIGTCPDACVVIPSYSPMGERVVEIGTGAFFECSTITAIQIPETVEHIGALAFGICQNLIYISVSDANPYYCDRDGVLYSADLGTLICYPPMRAEQILTIDAATTVILEMAFFDCANLKHIRYTGSAEQWERMLIGSKNYSLTAAAKTFACEHIGTSDARS